MAVDAQLGTTPWEDIEAVLAAALDAPARRPADPGLGGDIEAVAYWSFEPSLEIVLARAERPSDAQAVAAWRRRLGRRPVPLVLLIVLPHGRALVVGPGGDPPPVLELDPRAVADELAAAAELDPLEVRERLPRAWERARGAGGLAGVRNVGLFSTHYLAARAPRLTEWPELEAMGREAARRRSLPDRVEALGFTAQQRAEGVWGQSTAQWPAAAVLSYPSGRDL